MDVVIEKASEELVLFPEQTNLNCHYANRGNIVTNEEVKQISKLFLSKNRANYELLAIAYNK